MSTGFLITVIAFGVALLVTLGIILVLVIRGDIKRFIVEKMAEAEKMFTKDMKDYQRKRKEYVIQCVKDKYKIAEFIVNVKTFIEIVILISKEINGKK